MPTLTSSGSPTFNGDSSCTIDSTDVLQATVSLVPAAQGWVAARLKPSWASGTPPTNPRVFDIENVPAQSMVFTQITVGNWSFGYQSAGILTDTVADSHSAGDHITYICKWSSSSGFIKQSLNGGNFNVGTSPLTSAASPLTNFTIGNRNAADRPFTGDYYWFLMGSGDPSNADAATINGFGDTDPTWASIPATPVFVWYANDLTYLDSDPTVAQAFLPTFPRIRFNG